MGDMADRLFADTTLAALYDSFCPRERRDDFDFYMPMVMGAAAVLDVGCGTGAMLHEARDAGHLGRLCGLDPAAGMIEQARRRSDIEWVLGDLTASDWKSEFDLVIMTGHGDAATLAAAPAVVRGVVAKPFTADALQAAVAAARG